jgi:hypothetical protein
MTEPEAISKNLCPSPFADAVAHVFIEGKSVQHLMLRFGLDAKEVFRLVSWVCETNLRRVQ